MKKLLFTIMLSGCLFAMASCGDSDDNGNGNGNGNGGTYISSVAMTIKEVKRTFTPPSRPPYTEIITFSYDSNNKLTKIETVDQDDPYTYTINLTYPASKVLYTCISSEGSSTETFTGELTLHSDGYAMFGKAGYDNLSTSTWTPSYTANGYVNGVSGTLDQPGSIQETFNRSIEWTGGNMTKAEFDNTSDIIYTDLTYSNLPNPNTNIDLNWLATDTEALCFTMEGYSGTHTANMFMMGYYGKRSANLVSKISETWNSNNDIDDVTYSISDGAVKRITIVNIDGGVITLDITYM